MSQPKRTTYGAVDELLLNGIESRIAAAEEADAAAKNEKPEKPLIIIEVKVYSQII